MTDFEKKTLKQVQGDVLIMNSINTSCRIHFGISLSLLHYAQLFWVNSRKDAEIQNIQLCAFARNFLFSFFLNQTKTYKK